MQKSIRAYYIYIKINNIFLNKLTKSPIPIINIKLIILTQSP